MNKLQIFLYLLMRDELPTGKVARLIQEVEKVSEQPSFTNGHLAEMAREYEERLQCTSIR